MVTALSESPTACAGCRPAPTTFSTKPVNDVALFARVRSLVRLKRMTEEWRLREEVYGRFDTVIAETRRAEDLRPGAHPAVGRERLRRRAHQRDAAAVATSVRAATRRCSCREMADASIDLVILSLARRGDALRLVAQLRARRRAGWCRSCSSPMATSCRALPRGSISAPTTTSCGRWTRTSSPRARAPRSGASDCRTGCRTIISAAWRSALTDSLTGLYNRRYLMAHLDGLMMRAAEGAQGPAVLMLDIDYFKRVNDEPWPSRRR